MYTGFSFIDMLVSKVTMAAAAAVFLICAFLLFFKRKKLGAGSKILSAAGIIITGVYLGFILFIVIMWGSQIK